MMLMFRASYLNGEYIEFFVGYCGMARTILDISADTFKLPIEIPDPA